MGHEPVFPLDILPAEFLPWRGAEQVSDLLVGGVCVSVRGQSFGDAYPLPYYPGSAPAPRLTSPTDMQVPQLPQETTHLLLATRSSLIGKNLGFAWVPERTSWKFSEEISLATQ